MELSNQMFKTLAVALGCGGVLGTPVYAQDAATQPAVIVAEDVSEAELVSAPIEQPTAPLDASPTPAYELKTESIKAAPLEPIYEPKPCEPVGAAPLEPIYEPRPCEPVAARVECSACEPVAIHCAPPTCVQDCRPLPVDDVPFNRRAIYVSRQIQRDVVKVRRDRGANYNARVAANIARREIAAERRRAAMDRGGSANVSFTFKRIVEINRETR